MTMPSKLNVDEELSGLPLDPYRNIFFYYRGSAKRSRKQPSYESQLENNVTKSLINVLDLCEPPGPLQAFLELVDTRLAETGNKRPRLWRPDRSYRFSLQSRPSEVTEARDRLLVTLSQAGLRQDSAVPVERQTGGRPDAWIYRGTDVAVMIESKLANIVDESQLVGHARDAGWHDYSRCDLHWEDVYRCIRAKAVDTGNRKDRLLMLQFLNYLEVTGMSGFQGFRNSDFDLFISYGENEALRPVVKNKLAEFARQVYDRLPENLRSAHPDFHLGNMHSSGVWAAFRKAQNPKDPLRHCNLIVQITRNGLSLAAVVRDGRATDRRKPIGILRRKLKSPDGDRQLRQTLSELGGEYWLVVHRRTDRAENDQPRSGNEVWHEKARFKLDFAADEAVASTLQLIQKIPFPGLHVRTEVPRGSPPLAKPENLIRDAAAKLAKLRPVLAFLED